MRKHPLFFIFFFSIILNNSSGQELKPFYDRNTGLWGFQDAETKQIVIPPQFENATGWWKEHGIVQIRGKYGLVDRTGNLVTQLIDTYIYVKADPDCDTISHLSSYYNYDVHAHFPKRREFFINENCDCVPHPFYPCPPQVKMDTSETPQSLKYIQQAEYLFHKGEITKALQKADRAILTDTNDASAYLWKAGILADGWSISILAFSGDELQAQYMSEGAIEYKFKSDSLALINKNKADKLSSGEFENLMENLIQQHESDLNEMKKGKKMMDSISVFNDRWREEGLNYINTKFDTSFHLHYYYDKAIEKSECKSYSYYAALAGKYELNYLPKTEKRKIKREIIKGLKHKYRKGESHIMLSGGYGFFPYQKWEANLTHGYATMLDHLFGFVGWGVGVEKSVESNLSCYKAVLLAQPIGIIHWALNLMVVEGYGNSDWGFRPEFGFSYSGLTVLYGFNFINNSKFPGARGNMVALRLHLPVWRKNEFRKDLGNNLYR